jgi:hypothetical protein
MGQVRGENIHIILVRNYEKTDNFLNPALNWSEIL